MAKSFIYDDMSFATAESGTWSGAAPATFVLANGPSNPEMAIDQSIGTGVGGTNDFDAGDAIRFDLGSAITKASGGALAVYCTSAPGATVDIALYAGAAFNMGTLITLSPVGTAALTSGWNVYSFTPPSASRYWFLAIDTASIAELVSEVIIGTKYTFDVNFPVGDDEYDRPNVDVIQSYGAQEYANKRANLKREWSWRWEIPTAAMRTSLRTFDTAVQKNFLKFLFYNDEDTTYYWVRMDAESLRFKRDAFDHWGTNVKLTQQLI